MTPSDLAAWAQAHASWLAAPVLAATHAALYMRNAARDIAPVRAAWRNLFALLKLLKGANMNPMTLIPLALTGLEDAAKLYQDIGTGDKAAAIAAIEDAIPVLAALVGKPEADLRLVLTPDAVGQAFDLIGEGVKLAGLVEQALARYAAAHPAA